MKKVLIAYLTYLLLFLIFQVSMFVPDVIRSIVFMNIFFVNVTFLFTILFVNRIKKRPWFWLLFLLIWFIVISLCSMFEMIVYGSASNGGAEGGGGGGHSIVWVDKPDSKSKDETVSFEFGPSTPNVFGGPSVVISGVQKGHSGSDISILTTPEQDAAAIAKIKDIKNKRPSYCYPFRNCADMARDVLNAAGLNLPSRIIDTPAKLLKDLKKVDR